MRDNPIQFAVVREDPDVEATLAARVRARRALLVASGGCTAFALKQRAPELELTLLDPNPAQLELVRRKVAALRDVQAEARLRAFNVEDVSAEGLAQCGNFEALFRQLRAFLNEFVVTEAELRAFFSGQAAPDACESWFRRPYWRVAFELFFSDALLEAMFTPAATQHAVKGSYPAYFQAAFERGLRRGDARENYFLHHVLLGAYRREAPPPYLVAPPRLEGIELQRGRFEDVADFAPYDLISLSNVLDWMDEGAIARLAQALCATTRPGAVLVLRQLNNAADHAARLAPAFTFDDDLGRSLLERDRSLFYQSIRVGTRNP